jgi:Fe-Mn family superoxide dismutase
MQYSSLANQLKYPFILPELPFDSSLFIGKISQETFDYHHKMHHNAYVVNLNKLLEVKPELQSKSLEELIILSSKDPSLNGIFNNAAQVWNHTFYWHSITPNYKLPEPDLLEMIEKDFGSLDDFHTKFENAGITQFGSGWAWLVLKDNKLDIIKTSNAENPLCQGYVPILTCDVWEHAYYIDYRNRRPNYLKDFLAKLINWEFVYSNIKSIQNG